MQYPHVGPVLSTIQARFRPLLDLPTTFGSRQTPDLFKLALSAAMRSITCALGRSSLAGASTSKEWCFISYFFLNAAFKICSIRILELTGIEITFTTISVR